MGTGGLRTVDEGAVEMGGTRRRPLLIRLTLDAGRTVPTGALVDAVWPDRPPAGAGNALQALVSRLRRAPPGPAPPARGPGGFPLRPPRPRAGGGRRAGPPGAGGAPGRP